MPANIHLTWVDYSILIIYFVFVIGIGVVLKRSMTGSKEFFTSGRSIPAWVTGLAFLSANLGAQEVIGMAASGAKYGIMTSHFYWVGAIPAMVFLAIFMMPFYYGSKARSVPEYLKLRFDEKTRGLNAITFAVMTIFSSGISLHALAKLLGILVHWDYWTCISVSAAIVLVYIFLGGLTSAIYNEVLQFFMIVLGFAPLVYLGLRKVGGWTALKAQLIPVATQHVPPYAPGTWTHAWTHMGNVADNPMGADVFSMVVGLGFVLSFGYWCTDFLVVQRAMAANSMSAARRTPLIAAVPKMLFPALVILPGMIAIALHTSSGGHFLPIGADGKPDYDLTIPTLLGAYFPTGILGVGFTALMASFMSGMAGNVTAFNTVWTYDLYQSYLAPDRTDAHYLRMGRAATVVGILLSIGAAVLASNYNNIMDMLQLVFSFVNAPLFATFLLGMFWTRATGHGAFWGLVSGTVGALVVHGLSITAGNAPGVKGGWITPLVTFPSEMSQNFRLAIVAWTFCFLVTVGVSLLTARTKTDRELTGLVYSLTQKPPTGDEPWYQRPVVLGVLILAATLALSVIFA